MPKDRITSLLAVERRSVVPILPLLGDDCGQPEGGVNGNLGDAVVAELASTRDSHSARVEIEVEQPRLSGYPAEVLHAALVDEDVFFEPLLRRAPLQVVPVDAVGHLASQRVPFGQARSFKFQIRQPAPDVRFSLSCKGQRQQVSRVEKRHQVDVEDRVWESGNYGDASFEQPARKREDFEDW